MHEGGRNAHGTCGQTDEVFHHVVELGDAIGEAGRDRVAEGTEQAGARGGRVLGRESARSDDLDHLGEHRDEFRGTGCAPPTMGGGYRRGSPTLVM